MGAAIGKADVIPVDEERCRKCMTDALGSLHYCNVRRVLVDGYVSMLGVAIQCYERYEEKE